MMNNQSKDADSKARARAEQSAQREREAAQRRKEEERRRKAEEERRAREEERKRREAEQRKRRPKEAETRMADQQKPEAGPYTRTLMDNVLAHEGDTNDPFLMELNRDSWEQEYRDGRTKALRGAVERLADDLMAGRAKPEEESGKQGNWTAKDLADPFLQGLFGEQELKNEFVKGQLKQFAPALERRIAQLRDKVNGQAEEPQQKDTAYGTNMVYNTNKNGIQQADGGIKTLSGAYKDNEGQSLIQPMSAQVSGPQQGNAEDKTSTEAAQFGWQTPQPNAEDKEASLENAQFGRQTPQEGDAEASNTQTYAEAVYGGAKAQGQPKRGYGAAPTELKQMYDILGDGDTGSGISFDNIEKSFGKDIHFEMDDYGKVIGDYREAFENRINEQYPDISPKDKEILLEGTLLLLKAEFGKQNADPEKIIDVTDQYRQMVTNSLNNPFWQREMLGVFGDKGVYYLKDEPKAIQKLCGDQIPEEIMDEALRIGGEKGVNYLMQQGYGYFRVGDKVMSPEELGNYSLGVIATGHGHSRAEGYEAANMDRWRMAGSEYGELYDKYYQTMGMNDLQKWQ
ncbi:hypothetical protein CE91St36_07260 [Christensenellaceae bacterium]|nr:hypothetical protein CE91St36_07260 [Christensenellaceae bacterium]BDF60577.1 hypothetical protein CE91St37_07270 [Christensenellaceae bacterium]